jgi:hypothetical protein
MSCDRRNVVRVAFFRFEGADCSRSRTRCLAESARVGSMERAGRLVKARARRGVGRGEGLIALSLFVT